VRSKHRKMMQIRRRNINFSLNCTKKTQKRHEEKSPEKETLILEMCPNLGKFLLGHDKIWRKFAIEYLYSLFFWRSKFYTN
jgi:hypothetical protein